MRRDRCRASRSRSAPPPGAVRRAVRRLPVRRAPPGTHSGLPSPDLTVVLSLGPPTRLCRLPDPGASPGEFDAFGFEKVAVYTGDDPTVVDHAELRWPGGGGVMLGSVRQDSSTDQ